MALTGFAIALIVVAGLVLLVLAFITIYWFVSETKKSRRKEEMEREMYEQEREAAREALDRLTRLKKQQARKQQTAPQSAYVEDQYIAGPKQPLWAYEPSPANAYSTTYPYEPNPYMQPPAIGGGMYTHAGGAVTPTPRPHHDHTLRKAKSYAEFPQSAPPPAPPGYVTVPMVYEEKWVSLVPIVARLQPRGFYRVPPPPRPQYFPPVVRLP